MLRRVNISFGACLYFLMVSVVGSGADTPAAQGNVQTELENVTQGALRIVGKDGGVVECPLKHTDVRADISGFIARVGVTQTFANPTKEKIEAVYVFPLPHEAAVDAMTMTVGDRKIVGLIKRREEARQVYQEALAAGQTAALLEQERPNIFTQSVGNIEPGQEVKIEISYVDVLRYDVGTYEFQFPMVVGPRYIPGQVVSTPQATSRELQGKVSPPVPNTNRVPDAERISPPVMKPGVRNGHDIALTMNVDAGVPIQNLSVANHRAEVSRNGERQAKIVLTADDSIPNKDFIVRYDVVGKRPAMAMLAHTGTHSADAKALGEGYFMLMVQPQDDERLNKSPPRDIVFLVDVSGSMSGEPTAKVVETMQHMLKLCRPQDTLQVVTFASQANKLFEKPVPVTPDNIQRALGFTAGLQGSGGTEMLKGVRLAIDEPIEAQRLRVIVMLTDGYIGNEAEIIEHVGRHCGDQIRFWCVGIGQSPNMFLVDGVAKQGGGMGKQLGLRDDSALLSQEIMTRIQRAQLSRVKIDWGKYQVSQTYPARIPELWAGRPIVVFGRYTGGGQTGTITVSGTIEGEPASWPLEANLPAKEAAHDVLASVWARRKIEDLMQQAFYQESPAVAEEVTAIALDYRLMSQYTSFVAVDEKDAAKPTERANPPRRMLVPVPLPEGTRWEGFFGEEWGAIDFENVALERKSISHPRALSFGMPAMPTPNAGRQAYKSIDLSSAATVNRTNLSRGDSPIGFRGLSDASPALGASRSRSMRSGFGNTPGLSRRFARGGYGGGLGGSGGGKSAQPRRLARGVTDESLRAPAQALKLYVTPRIVVSDTVSEVADEYARLPSTTAPQANELLEAARNALKVGLEHQTKNELDSARMALTRACFQATAVANAGLHDEEIADKALAALEEVRTAQVAQWTKSLAVLDKRLDLVLRDKSITDAVAMLAKATGTKIDVNANGLADSESLLGQPPRVNYLDLRHATLAESLDWLLLPARMSWRLTKDQGIIVATERRLDGESAWIYDITYLTSPVKSEIDEQQDEQKRSNDAMKEAEALLNMFRAQASGAKPQSIAWFAPGHLLVIGLPDQHAAIAKLIADLADPKAKLSGAAGKMHAKTIARAEQHQKDRIQRRAAEAAQQVALAHHQFGWRLLSEAAAGRVDDEALTELRIAWSNPETTKMLADDRAAHVLRSAWAVIESAKIVGSNDELQTLAVVARANTQKAADAAVEAIQSKESNRPSLVAAIYGALANQTDAGRIDRLIAVLKAKAKEKENAAAEPTLNLVLAILAPTTAESRAALSKAASDGVEGEDAIVLLAWACRQAGDETWSTFRSQSSNQLGDQPLPGDVVVLVNRLGEGNR